MKKILVVDDNEDLLKMLKMRIEGEGYEFIGAEDGIDMLNVIKKNKPDLVLLDVMMPKMDGYSALRELRKEDEFKDIPVIILTAKEKQKVGDLFVLENITAFVEKPFDAKDLMKKISNLL